MIIIQKHSEQIEKLRIKKDRLKKGHEISFCSKQKKRIAWDHYVTSLEMQRSQREYVKLCDVMVSSKEIELFLQSQNLNLTL